MGQLLLIPDPRPLDERFGRAFFRNIPKQTGVYLMRDAADIVLYVGKAKSLRQRLGNYRIANPDKMPRRRLRMLRRVARIEFQVCTDEASALKHEAALLRTLKPRFNRAGVWPSKAKFIIWKKMEGLIQLAVTERPEPTWHSFGPLGAMAEHLHKTLSRMLWLALNPTRSYGELPSGWAKGAMPPKVEIEYQQSGEEVLTALTNFFRDSGDEFLQWLMTHIGKRGNHFNYAVIESELEILKEFAAKRERLRSSQFLKHF